MKGIYSFNNCLPYLVFLFQNSYRIAGNFHWKKFSLKIQKAFRINFRWNKFRYLVLTASRVRGVTLKRHVTVAKFSLSQIFVDSNFRCPQLPTKISRYTVSKLGNLRQRVCSFRNISVVHVFHNVYAMWSH